MYRYTFGIVTFVLFILATASLCSQEAILSSGGDAAGSEGTVAYSVGQAAYTHFIDEEGQISLGVQQPHLVIVVSTDEPLPAITVALYPNPVQSTGFLELSSSTVVPDVTTCTFELYDIFGRLLLQKDIVDYTTSISMEHFENAMYLLKVICQDAEIKTFKVIKTN